MVSFTVEHSIILISTQLCMTSEMVQKLKTLRTFMFTDVLIHIHTVICIPIHKNNSSC